jgi:hypothetical protein
MQHPSVALYVARLAVASGFLIRINSTSKEYSADLRHMSAEIAVNSALQRNKITQG